MKYQTIIAVALASIAAITPLAAQTGATAAAPAVAPPLQYLGKTFADCEKLLGKPTSEEPVDQPFPRAFRYYKSPLAQASRIRLMQTPKTPVLRQFTNAVTHVTYYFPKGRLKNWRDAFALLGLPANGLKEKSSPAFTTVTGIPGGFLAQWTPASAEAIAGTTASPDEDKLLFMPDPNFKP